MSRVGDARFDEVAELDGLGVSLSQVDFVLLSLPLLPLSKVPLRTARPQESP